MSREVLLLVDALAREKNVDKEIVFGALESALASATKKRFSDEEADVRVSIDRQTGEYESFRRWQVMLKSAKNNLASISVIYFSNFLRLTTLTNSENISLDISRVNSLFFALRQRS